MGKPHHLRVFLSGLSLRKVWGPVTVVLGNDLFSKIYWEESLSACSGSRSRGPSLHHWPHMARDTATLHCPQTSIPQNHLGDVFKCTLLKQTSRVMKIFISNKYSDDASTASRDHTFPPIVVFSVWETQLTEGNIYPLLENSAWEPSYTDSPPPQPGPPAFLGPQGRKHVITQRAWVKWLRFM